MTLRYNIEDVAHGKLAGARVFVSGPYSSDPEGHVQKAIEVADLLASHGAIPFVPHLYHFWDAQHPRPYEDWMRFSLAWLSVCDLLVRLPGLSPGADREVARARALEIPVAGVSLVGESLTFEALYEN